LRRSALVTAVAFILGFFALSIAADDQTPNRLKAVSTVVAGQLAKYDANGNTVASTVTETSGYLFVPETGRLYLWPDIAGSYLFGDPYGFTLYGKGGTIKLSNADTVVNGYGPTALTVKGSGSTSAAAALDVKSLAGTSLLFVRNDGNIGIGTPSPGSKLEVSGTARFGTDFLTMPSPTYGGIMIGEYGGGATGELQFLAANAGSGYGYKLFGYPGDGSFRIQRRESSTTWLEAVTLASNGNFGIGTTIPGTRLDVLGTALVYGGARRVMRVFDDAAMAAGVGGGVDFMGKYTTAGAYTQFANLKGVKANATSGDFAGKFVVSVDNSAGSVIEIATVDMSGLAVTGNITATGSITGATVVGAVYQDVAEWVPATSHMEPGTVVVLNRRHRNEVMPSAHAYDTAVAGVVSAQPGVILGVASDSKAQIATTGRVNVHVDATAGAIEIGDLLVTGNKPGTAMKSQPVDLGGVSFHRPGTVIGKALEPLPDGDGEILVLLSLQ